MPNEEVKTEIQFPSDEDLDFDNAQDILRWWSEGETVKPTLLERAMIVLAENYPDSVEPMEKFLQKRKETEKKD